MRSDMVARHACARVLVLGSAVDPLDAGDRDLHVGHPRWPGGAASRMALQSPQRHTWLQGRMRRSFGLPTHSSHSVRRSSSSSTSATLPSARITVLSLVNVDRSLSSLAQHPATASQSRSGHGCSVGRACRLPAMTYWMTPSSDGMAKYGISPFESSSQAKTP